MLGDTKGPGGGTLPPQETWPPRRLCCQEVGSDAEGVAQMLSLKELTWASCWVCCFFLWSQKSHLVTSLLCTMLGRATKLQKLCTMTFTGSISLPYVPVQTALDASAEATEVARVVFHLQVDALLVLKQMSSARRRVVAHGTLQVSA